MKAVKNFKKLIDPAKAEAPMQSILGQEYETHFVQPPLEMEPEESLSARDMPPSIKSQSLNTYNRKLLERDLVLRGYHDQPLEGHDKSQSPVSTRTSASQDSDDLQNVHTSTFPCPQPPLSRASSATTKRSVEGTRGHARDPLEEEYPYLFIGPSTYTGSTTDDTGNCNVSGTSEQEDGFEIATPEISDAGLKVDIPIVSESPGAADFDIYETAYRKEVERIRKRSLTRRGTETKVYLTRRVEGKDHVKKLVEEVPASGEDPGPESVSEIGEKRAVPPVTATVSLMTTQFAPQQEQQPTDQGQPVSALSSSTSILGSAAAGLAATGTRSTSEDPKSKLRSLVDSIRNSGNS